MINFGLIWAVQIKIGQQTKAACNERQFSRAQSALKCSKVMNSSPLPPKVELIGVILGYDKCDNNPNKR
jgi:hypothetical protein